MAPPKPFVLFYAPGLVGGGAERVWALLANAFAARGYRVHFAQDFAVDPPVFPLDPAISVTTLGAGHGQAVRALTALLRSLRPDIALSAIAGSNFKLALAAQAARTRTPLIFSYHGFEEHKTGRLSWLTYKSLPMLSRAAARIVAVSDGLKEHLAENFGARRDRLVRIYNPVAFPAPAPGLDASALAARSDTIIAVGRLVPDKDLATLIAAFSVLDRPSSRLEILGEGPERAALEALVAERGLAERVTFRGFVAEPWAAYGSAKCLALSSRTEAFGNVVVEALSQGLPVVATDCAGPAEILDHGRYGAIVPRGDVAALAGALAAALDNPGDPAPRLARAELFSAERGITQYEALVADVLAGAQTRA